MFLAISMSPQCTLSTRGHIHINNQNHKPESQGIEARQARLIPTRSVISMYLSTSDLRHVTWYIRVMPHESHRLALEESQDYQPGLSLPGRKTARERAHATAMHHHICTSWVAPPCICPSTIPPYGAHGQ